MVTRKRQFIAALLGGVSSLSLATSAQAIPKLQLDIDGPNVVYNHVADGINSEETIVTTGNEFTVRALGLPGGTNEGGNSTLSPTDTVWLSIAIIPKVAENEGGTFGSFDLTYGGVTETIDITADMTWGIPPIALTDDPGEDNLPKHGIFETYYTERSYLLNTSDLMVTPYNSQDTPGAVLDTPGTGEMFVKLFDVVLNLNEGVEIGLHFDLYTLDLQGGILLKAPFSHDAEGGSGPGPGPGTPPGGAPPFGSVPEPITATMGVMAMGALSTTLRRRR